MAGPPEISTTPDDRLAPTSPLPRRQGPATAAKQERRKTRACDGCRRLKEKCNGGTPCARCMKADRQCIFTDAYRRSRARPTVQKPNVSADPIDPKSFFDVDRIRNLETIVKHYASVQDCSPATLEGLVSALVSDKESIAPSPYLENLRNTEDSSGDARTKYPASLPAYEEFSHLDFTHQIQQKIAPDLERSDASTTINAAAAEPLLSRTFIVQDAASLFPPAEVATILLDIFFNISQTNYFYVDERIQHRISDFYTQMTPLTIADAPWVCTALMVFCVSTQFAHLAQRNKGRYANSEGVNVPSAIDDAFALSFYRKATSMIPDLLTIGCPQSVQAFILMGVYSLPLDPSGLASRYYAIAIKIAIHNNMHLKVPGTAKTYDQEVRNRIWWTVYTLDRRVCILHGRPASIQRSDINASLPSNCIDPQSAKRVNTYHNMMAQKSLTEIMEDARDAILIIKKSEKPKLRDAAKKALNINQILKTWWEGLPKETFCTDLTPGEPLFRSNIHLALTYHLTHIFIGRSFIFDSSGFEPDDLYEWVNTRNTLIQDCLKSAVTSIQLCQTLNDEFGLSKSSYTEFTSCCAAVMTLVAQRITTETIEFNDICDQGLVLLKMMSGGVFTKSSEKRGLEILEMALVKLSMSQGDSPFLGGAGYTEFRNWVTLQAGPGQVSRPQHASPIMEWAYNSSAGEPSPENDGLSLMPDFIPTTFADLASLPGLENYFQYSIG
ncbi:unnamed protein product [Clonostachys rosea]|uniref:Zn(2)-C6 fungal-type domain-containing protein n=1 Tax=Bionectria ochroleuca TaxID=29856 RepID=A0ABY6UYB2_BIOOC|nr:unnamed protein product [Clonostachys rosea]